MSDKMIKKNNMENIVFVKKEDVKKLVVEHIVKDYGFEILPIINLDNVVDNIWENIKEKGMLIDITPN
jgi:predicted transcriptional regulator